MRRGWVDFLLLSAFLLGTPLSWGDTQVPPVITGDQTWTESGSPYRISRDTLVSSGATLTLQSGVLVIVSSDKDATIPNITPRVDLVVQGALVIQGTDGKPVRIQTVGRSAPWGALYIASGKDTTLHGLDMQGGRLVIANTHLTLEDCRVSGGEGIQVGAHSLVDLVRCQIDANELGIAFLDASAQVRMVRTRLWDDETAIYYKTNGTLLASESSITQCDKWYVVNATPYPVKMPVFWWGTPDPTDLTSKVYDGSRRKGIGMVSFEGVAPTDPFAPLVSGFTPKEDPRERLWRGPKYLVDLHFQWVMPHLNIKLKTGADGDGNDIWQKAKFKSTLGYGGSIGWLANPDLEMRALVQTCDLTSSDPVLNSHLDLSFFQVGVAGRYLIPLNELKSLFLYGEAGGLLTFDSENNTAPLDPTKPGQNLQSHTHKETAIGFEGGVGVMTRLGKSYKAQIGLHDVLLPLQNGRGGSLLELQAGLAFYFR